MSATAKTLSSLGVALVGLLVYVGVFIGLDFKISLFGLALYFGLAMTAVMLITVVELATASSPDEHAG